MRKLLKWTLASAVLATAAAVVAYASLIDTPQRQGGRRGSFDRNAPVPVLTAEVRLADVPLYLDGVGTARARKIVTVRPQVDGKIISVDFKEGQEVKRGDVLAKIDPASYQAQLDQAIAKKALDDVQLANAKRDLERYTQLGSNIIAAKTIDTQRALVGQLEAQIRVDDAAIANAKTFLDYTTIVSPIDGRTGIRMVDEGNLVRASDAGLVVITEIRPISVLFTLPQQQLAAVNQALAKGTVVVDALDTDSKNPVDRGTLQVVDNQVDQTTGTVRMKADFPNANLQLWPGQFVNVRVLMETLNQVVVVPTPAVQRGPNGTFAYVVGADETVALRPISIRQQTDTLAVVAQGLDPSERVVTTGFARLKDGAHVIVDTPQEAQPTASTSKGSSNIRTVCAADVEKLCANAARGKGALRDCLQTNAAQLTETCKAAINRNDGGSAREAGARKGKEAMR